jgi:hypothetical protein
MAKIGRPRGAKNGSGAAQPKPFTICYRGGEWRIQINKNWRRAREISLLAPVLLLPDGRIVGTGVLTYAGDVLTVTA